MVESARSNRPFAPIPGLTVLGVSGKANSGKSWLASQLRKYGWQPWALAWHLKHDALKGGEFSYEDVHYFKPPDVRRHLQLIGTEGGRDIYGEDVWLRVAYAWMRLMREEHGLAKIVIPDVRFPNEARFVRALGGKLIRLEHGPGLIYTLAGSDAAEHPSETALDAWKDWDMVIQNGPSSFPPGHVQIMLNRLGLLNNGR